MPPLSDLLSGTAILRTGGDGDVLSVPVEPRQLADGTFFFKLRSTSLSAADAIRRGARYVVLTAGDEEESSLPPNVSYAIVDHADRAFARTCARLFGEAHRRLTLIGVTGAKGKTTVCHLIEAGLRSSGVRVGMLSSLAMRLPESERAATGPACDALSIHSFLAVLRKVGGTHAVLELTSHAIADDRLFGLQFDSMVFTNSGAGGGDDAHMAANRRLFTDPAFQRSAATLCVFNSDDEAGRELARSSLGQVVTYGLDAGAEWTPEVYSCDRTGITVRLSGRDLRIPLIGRQNVSNVLAAAAIVDHTTGSQDAVLQLESVRPLPGRMERLPSAIDVDVYLDQAYLPSNIEMALSAVREFAGSRRIVCVVGCSGGDDKRQRPARARAAVNGSDTAMLTCDDPRDEHPATIVMDMLKGVPHAAPGQLKTILDRPTAIDTAIQEALPDGIVVILGKRAMREELRGDDRHLAMDVLLRIRKR